MEDDYELGEMLGDGAFSVVRLARHRKTGKQVAVKVIPRELQSEESIRHEVGVLRRVGMHRAIAKLEDYFESPTHHYIVMEYVDGGELFDHLATAGAYSEKDAAALLQQLAGAVALLHAQKLGHADIKPENLLSTRDGQLKLVDFGLSTQVKKGAAQRMKGTWVNWPPEAFSKSYDVTLAADMWAIGVVAYIMLAGYHPFDCVDGATDTQARAQFRRAIRRAQFPAQFLTSRHRPAQIQRRIMAGTFDFEDPLRGRASPPPAASSSRVLLRADPERRLTVEELLQHRWLTSEAGSDDQKLAA